MENWKVIGEFPAYEVSDLGRVRRGGKVLKGSANNKDYLTVALCKDRKAHTKSVHTLVAKTFIPNPLNLPEVNHKGEKSDNRATMLEWRSKAGHAQDQALRTQQGEGVFFNKWEGVWCAAYFPKVHKRKIIGRYATQAEAQAARNKVMASWAYIL